MRSTVETPSDVGYVGHGCSSDSLLPADLAGRARRGSRRRVRPAGRGQVVAGRRGGQSGSGCVRSARRRPSTTGSSPSSVGQLDAAAYVVDRPARDAGRGQDVEPLLRGPGGQPLQQHRPQLLAVVVARPDGGEPLVVGDRRRCRARRPGAGTGRRCRRSRSGRRRRWAAARTGTGTGARCPSGVGTTSPATYAEVWLTSVDSAVDSRLVSIVLARRRCASRWCSAARMPIAECSPVITSKTEMPARYGGPSGDPVRLISPDTAWTSRS